MLAVTPEQRPALPLTASSEISQGVAVYAYKQHSKLVKMSLVRRRLRAMMGAIIMEYRDMSLWRALGDESFEAWLGRNELGFNRRQAYRYMEYYAQGVKLVQPSPDTPALATADQIDRIGPTKLAILKPVLQQPDVTPQQRAEWLQEAEAQPMSALRIQVDEHMGHHWSQRREFLHAQVGKLVDMVRLLEIHDDPLAIIAQVRAALDTTEDALQTLPAR